MYYGQAVNSTVIHAISDIASQQAVPTEETMEHTKQILDYLSSQEEVDITYSASDMTLAVHSDAGYLNEPKAKAEQAAISFSPTTLTSRPTMEPSSILHT